MPTPEDGRSIYEGFEIYEGPNHTVESVFITEQVGLTALELAAIIIDVLRDSDGGKLVSIVTSTRTETVKLDPIKEEGPANQLFDGTLGRVAILGTSPQTQGVFIVPDILGKPFNAHSS